MYGHPKAFIIHNQTEDVVPGAHFPAEFGRLSKLITDRSLEQLSCPLIELRFLLFTQRLPVLWNIEVWAKSGPCLGHSQVTTKENRLPRYAQIIEWLGH